MSMLSKSRRANDWVTGWEYEVVSCNEVLFALLAEGASSESHWKKCVTNRLQLCSSPARFRLWILKRVWQLYSVKHKRGALSDAREPATCRYRGSVIWRQIGTVSAVANLSEWRETESLLAASLAFLSTQRGMD